MTTPPPPYTWSDEATRLAHIPPHTTPSWLDEDNLPEVTQQGTGATVPFTVWRGFFAQGELLFDIRSTGWGRHEPQRTKQGGALQPPYAPEERDTLIAASQALLQECEELTLENFWLAIWEQWEAHKKPDRAWFLPTMALYPCRANAYRLLGFYLTLSDSYLVRNMGQQQSARILSRWPLPVARHVLDQAGFRIRENYEKKALVLAVEDELGTPFEAWTKPKPEPDFGLDAEGRRLFDLGARHIEMSCDLEARTISWRELPSGKNIKGFPRKKKTDDALLFSLARHRYRSMREELERTYL